MESLSKNELFDGRYLLLEKRGQGSYGEVWRAKDLRTELVVALKIYYSLAPQHVQLLKSEYVLASSLNHPNLLKAIYIGSSDYRLYIVMPYYPSTSAQLIGCCNEQTVWKLVRDVADGLAYLHDRNIIHCDIKPDNILFDEGGVFLLSDSGINAKTRSTLSLQADNNNMPSATAYMGPEMFSEEPYSVYATDIWALGATIYEILTNSLPFFGQGGAMQNHGAELPDIPFGFVSDNLIQLMYDCLAKDPWERPRAHEIVKYAEEVLYDEQQASTWKEYFTELRGVSEPPVAHKSKRWWWIIGAAASILIGVVAAFLLDGKESSPEMLADNLFVDTIPVPDNAISPGTTFLKVNGQEHPTPLHFSSKENEKTLAVETDGDEFMVNVEDLPLWITVNEKTDTSFVLKIVQNKSVQKRDDVINVVSGNLTISIPVIQDADQEMVNISKLTPVSDIKQVQKEIKQVNSNH